MRRRHRGERRPLPPRGPLRKIVGHERGDALEWDVLECGHLKLIGADAGAERRRCDDCAVVEEGSTDVPERLVADGALVRVPPGKYRTTTRREDGDGAGMRA